jgi:hypothetical protein
LYNKKRRLVTSIKNLIEMKMRWFLEPRQCTFKAKWKRKGRRRIREERREREGA